MLKGPSNASTIEEYLDRLSEPRKSDIIQLHELIQEIVPHLEPVFLGGMLGYGPFHYKYPSGREGDACRINLASNKNYISLYCLAVKDGAYVAESYKERLPKASIGKSCVRFKKLDDVDIQAIRDLLKDTAEASYGI